MFNASSFSAVSEVDSYYLNQRTNAGQPVMNTDMNTSGFQSVNTGNGRASNVTQQQLLAMIAAAASAASANPSFSMTEGDPMALPRYQSHNSSHICSGNDFSPIHSTTTNFASTASSLSQLSSSNNNTGGGARMLFPQEQQYPPLPPPPPPLPQQQQPVFYVAGGGDVAGSTVTNAAVAADLIQQILSLQAQLNPSSNAAPAVCNSHSSGGGATPMPTFPTAFPSAPATAPATVAPPYSSTTAHQPNSSNPLVAAATSAVTTGHKVNGTQYDLAATYEGYVKRYNPVRGFGFITATHQIVRLDGSVQNHNAGGSDANLFGSSALPKACTSGNDSGSVGPGGVNSIYGETESNSNHNGAGSGLSQDISGRLGEDVNEVKVPVHVGDIFVHQSYVHMRGFRSLPVGGRVRFCIGFLNGQRSFQAIEVELLPQSVPPSYSQHQPPPPPPPALQRQSHIVGNAHAFTADQGAVGGGHGEGPNPVQRLCPIVPPEIVGHGHLDLGSTDFLLSSDPNDDDDDSPLVELASDVLHRLSENASEEDS